MFCTVRDVRNALTPGGVENDPATASSLPEWQIQDAIEEATSIVKMHVSGRYTIPEPDTEVVVDPDATPPTTETVALAPDPVRRWTRNIAAYLASLTHKRNQDVVVDDPVRLRYSMTMAFLTSILNGSMDLELDEVDNDSPGVHVENLYEGKLFGPEDFLLTPEGAVQHTQVLMPLRGWNLGQHG